MLEGVMPKAAVPVVAAKILPPPPRNGVARERLITGLRMPGPERLTAIVAPAGWGKTTLLTSWVHDAAEARPVAWVSLDEDDDQPVRFWTYVLSAIERVAPEVGATARGALLAPGVDLIGAVVTPLLNDLAASGGPLLIVLDDFHVVADHQIHETVEFLLTYLPPSAHLVIGSRADPPLPLARLRARGQLRELRAVDLAFTPAEAAVLLEDMARVPLDDVTVHGIVERTEGWAAGLTLAGLRARTAEDAGPALAAIRGDDRHLIDYLGNEVLEQSPRQLVDFLVETVALDRLSGELCDVVRGRSDSQALLEELERSQLFMVPLDGHREWYRLHRLMRDLVLQRARAELGDAGLVTQHRRAAEWSAAHRDHPAEVRHLLAAGDLHAAADRLATTARWFREHGQLEVFAQLAEEVHGQLAAPDARLVISLGMAQLLCGRPARARELLDLVRDRIDPDAVPVDGWRTAAGAAHALIVAGAHGPDDVEHLVSHAERAVELETDPDQDGYLLARLVLGLALGTVQRVEDATVMLLEVQRLLPGYRLDAFTRVQSAGFAAMALLGAGQMDAAARLVAEHAPAVADLEARFGDGAAPATMNHHVLVGLLSKARGDLEAALASAERAAHLARVFSLPSAQLSALLPLAELRHAAGDTTGSREVLDEARTVAEDGPVVPAMLAYLDEVESRIGRGAVRRARQQGRLVEELTDRELSLLRALQGTLTLREIGAELYLSINTVKGYAKSLYRKLGATSRADAVARGRALGLI